MKPSTLDHLPSDALRDILADLDRTIAYQTRLRNRVLMLLKLKREIVIPPEARAIMEKVCAHYHLTVDDLLMEGRPQHIVEPRQICCYLLRRKLGFTMSKTAWFIGRKDHGTVCHAINRVRNRMDTDPVFRQKMREWERN